MGWGGYQPLYRQLSPIYLVAHCLQDFLSSYRVFSVIGRKSVDHNLDRIRFASLWYNFPKVKSILGDHHLAFNFTKTYKNSQSILHHSTLTFWKEYCSFMRILATLSAHLKVSSLMNSSKILVLVFDESPAFWDILWEGQFFGGPWMCE